MKYLPKTFILISISIVFVYLLILALGNIPFSYITNFWIPGILIANLIFVVPFAIYLKLSKKVRINFVKNLAVSSVVSFTTGIIFMHGALPKWGNTEGWEMIANLFLSIAFVLVFIIASLISFFGVLIYKSFCYRPEKTSELTFSIIFSYIVPFFSLILFIWSFFLIATTLQQIL